MLQGVRRRLNQFKLMLGGSSTNQINSNKMVSNQVGKRIKNTFFVSCSIPWPSTCFTLAQGVKKNFASNTFQFKSSWFVELPPGNQSSLDTLIESLYTQIKNTFYKYDGWMLPQCYVRVWTLWGWFFVFWKPWVLNYEKNYLSLRLKHSEKKSISVLSEFEKQWQKSSYTKTSIMFCLIYI